MKPKPRYQPGDKIGGRYQVHQALMGGMGEVYLCLDLETIQPYALKTFQQRYLTNPKLRAAFENEVATWVALEKHPNIVRCFYMEILDSQPFMFLEWIAGEEGRGTDLRSWLRRGPLDLRLALDFTIDICRGLIHANEKQPGIVHRDLKPDNILITQDRVAKITDFGLAYIVQTAQLEITSNIGTKVDRRQSLLGREGIVGTPPYMAPEQWRGETLDIRTDIYAVGCILYELLTGRWPFQAETLDSLRRQHLAAAVPRLADDYAISSVLDALVTRCLAKRREERFAIVDELLQKLRSIYQQQFTTSPKTTPVSDGFVATDYNNRGKTYIELQQYEEALTDLGKAIQLDPNYAMAYNNRGGTYTLMKRSKEALTDLDKAIKLDPNYVNAYNNRGAAYIELQRHEEALSDFNKALDLDPTYARAYINRGTLYYNLEQYEKALTDYSWAIKLDRTFPQAYLGRGKIYEKLEQYEKALADYNQTIELDPTYTHAYYNRGNINFSMQNYDKAIADYTRTIQLDPNYMRAYAFRGAAYQQLQRHEEALADGNRFLQYISKMGPSNNTLEAQHTTDVEPILEGETIEKANSVQLTSEDYYHRGVTYYNREQYEEALTNFSRAIQLNANTAEAHNLRGATYKALQKHKEALIDYNRALELESTRAGFYYNRGTVLDELGRYEEALADYDLAIQFDPTLSQAFNNRGNTYRNLGQYDNALADYNRAIQLDPTYALPYSNRGYVYRKLARHADALADYSQAIRLGHIDAQLYYNRGNTYRDLQQYNEALADFERAIQLDPIYAEAYSNRGSVYYQIRQFDEALADFKRVIQLNPTLAPAYHNIGMIYVELDRLREALSYFEKAAQLGLSQGAQLANRVRQVLGIDD